MNSKDNAQMNRNQIVVQLELTQVHQSLNVTRKTLELCVAHLENFKARREKLAKRVVVGDEWAQIVIRQVNLQWVRKCGEEKMSRT